MKKIIFVFLFLIGCSAFAFSPNYCGMQTCRLPKAQKETSKPSPTPIADMVMGPHIGI